MLVKYSYLLFDWDGCLAMTLEVWLKAYKDELAKRNIFPKDIEIAHHFGDWDLGKHFGVTDFQDFNTEATAMARKMLAEVEMYPRAKDMLKTLHGQVKMAVISSGSTDILGRGLTHNGVSDLFDLVVSGDDVKAHKPDPEGINFAIDHLNADRNLTVMIGDSRKDIGAANNAEIDSILVYPDSHKTFYELATLKSLHPTHVVTSVAEVARLV